MGWNTHYNCLLRHLNQFYIAIFKNPGVIPNIDLKIRHEQHFWCVFFPRQNSRLKICPPKNFRKPSATDGTIRGMKKYWWVPMFLAAWFKAKNLQPWLEVGWNNPIYLGGGFKYFVFSPLPGEMIQFDEHIFQIGWFNHQVAPLFIYSFLSGHL